MKTSPGISNKKKLIFSIFTLVIMFFVIEWSGRLLISWRDYKKSSDIDWKIGLEEMKRRDSDIGHYYYTEKKRTLVGQEFKNDFYFIDCGVDSLRFRDDGIDTERKDKLLAVGDSFVWGYGVELNEIFTEQLEILNNDLDVINAGITAHTPQQYTRVIKRFVKSNVHFDGVLYNFFAGNDVAYEYAFREWSKNIRRFPELAYPSYMKTRLISYKAIQYEIAKKRGAV